MLHTFLSCFALGFYCNGTRTAVVTDVCALLAGGSSVFAARANKKVASILEAYPKAVKEGKELKDVKGVGKGSIEKVIQVMSHDAKSVIPHLLCSFVCLLPCHGARQDPDQVFLATCLHHCGTLAPRMLIL